MVKVLIIEDEIPNIKRLEKMLHNSRKDLHIVDVLQSLKSSISWLRNNEQPDIIFMDIKLTDGLSFEIFNQIKITAQVIFITAYDEYALRAFQVNGVDYLLKPLDAEKLERSIEKALAIKGSFTDQSLFELIRSMQVKEPISRTRFLVPYRDRFLLVKTDEVAYFTIENKVTLLVKHDGGRLVIEQSLEMLENELDNQVFFRISRQYIISMTSIRKIHQSFNGQLKVEISPSVTNHVSASRERSSQLKKWLDQSER